MPATPALDRFDIAILDILQTDNTTPQRVIAQAVNLSAPAVQRRIQRLKDSGVIRANVAVLDGFAGAKPLAHNAYKVELGKRAVVRALMRASSSLPVPLSPRMSTVTF